MKKTYTERFWEKVDMSGECWVWTGKHDMDGYGMFFHSSNHIVRAHRVSYTLTYGDIPKGLYILHRCNNPVCVRPDHLYAGDQYDNMQDAKQASHVTHGEGRYGAKLTQTQVDEMRRKYATGTTTHRKLGKEYGISATIAGLIVRGKKWRRSHE